MKDALEKAREAARAALEAEADRFGSPVRFYVESEAADRKKAAVKAETGELWDRWCDDPDTDWEARSWALLSDAVLDTFLASLKASGYVIEQDWREIESEPKDGGPCMFRSPRGGMFIAPSVESPTFDAVRQANLAIYKDSGQWPNAGFNPTHWKPLPAPPGDAK